MPAFVMIGILAVATCLFLPWIRPGGVPLDEPEGLTKAIGDLPRGTKIFAYQPWASWFEFVYPEDPVYSDSRIEIFPRQIWKDYSQVAFAGAGWRAVLDRWQPDAIVAKSSWDLIPYLKADPAWTLVHQDKDGLLFVRS